MPTAVENTKPSEKYLSFFSLNFLLPVCWGLEHSNLFARGYRRKDKDFCSGFLGDLGEKISFWVDSGENVVFMGAFVYSRSLVEYTPMSTTQV